MRTKSLFVIAFFACILWLQTLEAASQVEKQEVFRIHFKKLKKAREGEFRYKSPQGWRICRATTNEWSANPRRPDYSIIEKTPSTAKISVKLPCKESPGMPNWVALGWLVEMGLAAIGVTPTGAVAGSIAFLGAKASECGPGAENTWLNLTYHFQIVPDNQDECPPPGKGPPPKYGNSVPWIDFPRK